MTTHTRTDIEVSDYECAMNDCGHEVRPCPSWTEDACQECTARSWDEHEGPVVTWDECEGTGAIWDETFDPEPTDLWCEHHEAQGSCPVDGCTHHTDGNDRA